MSAKASITIQTAPGASLSSPSVVRNPRYVIFNDFFRRPDLVELPTSTTTLNRSQLILSSSPAPYAATTTKSTTGNSVYSQRVNGESSPKSAISSSSSSSKFRKFSNSFFSQSQSPENSSSKSNNCRGSSDVNRVTVTPLERRPPPSPLSNHNRLTSLQDTNMFTRSYFNRAVRAANNSARRHEFFTKHSASCQPSPVTSNINYYWLSSDSANSPSPTTTTTTTQSTIQSLPANHQQASQQNQHPVTIRNYFIDYNTYKNELINGRNNLTTATNGTSTDRSSSINRYSLI